MTSSGPSWSRYGSQRRLCARAGCNAPAVATLRFQSTERRAWLAELDDTAARTQGDLCQRHASSLVLPRGWELHDERPFAAAGTAAPPREPTPVDPVEIEVPAVDAEVTMPDVVDDRETSEVVEVSASVVVEEIAGEEIEAGEEPAAIEEPEPEPAVANDEGNGAGPVIGAQDDDAVEEALDSILDARTPLLQRAFRNARPAS
jgi:hypothetical protein